MFKATLLAGETTPKEVLGVVKALHEVLMSKAQTDETIFMML